MITIFLSIGIIAAFAIMFWLDRRQGPEPTPSIVHLFDILRNLEWDMDENDIKNTFRKFEKAKAIYLNKKSTLGLKEYYEGQEIYTTFTFANNSKDQLNRAVIRLSRTNEKDIDLLFSTLCKQYGQPEQNESGFEGSVKWVTEPGILTLENTAPEQYTLTIKKDLTIPKV